MNIIKFNASAYAHQGLSVLPTLADKRPACAWKEFTNRIMSDDEIERYRWDGIGIVCGKVSGNLELIDFDDHGSAFEPWMVSLPVELCHKLVIECTPSGGKHVYYRLEDVGYVPGNRKLAMKNDGHVLIETRGENGYVKCAPSKGYELMQGDLLHLPKVSPMEQEMMINAALALSETKITVTPESVHKPAPIVTEPTIDVPALLMRHGWKKTGESGGNEHWERPGKDGKSTSATWNREVFYVFSSNAAPFEPERGYSARHVAQLLEPFAVHPSSFILHPSSDSSASIPDPGPLPDEFLEVPGFVSLLAAHTLATAPYPNKVLAFAGALTMLAHLTGRNFRNPRNLRTNIYLLALADSGVGKDYPRKVNMNLATEVGIMPTMADRFASAEGLEDALLIHPASFFQVDEIDTLFASLNERGDSAMEKIYGALLQFATSSDTTYAMRKKAISQVGGKATKFDKIRAKGIREPHLTMLATGIPKYLWSAISERSMENGLLSRCLVFEAGERGTAGTPHFAPFDDTLLAMAKCLVEHGGFDGLDLENLEEASTMETVPEPITIPESEDAIKANAEIIAECEAMYAAADSNSAKALWSRGAEKASKLAMLYAISEDVNKPVISEAAVRWGWKVVYHLTKRMLYQASVYVHDNEFDALRQKAMRYLRDYGANGSLNHGALLRYMHIDSDTFRRVIETLVQSELITAEALTRGGFRYTLV